MPASRDTDEEAVPPVRRDMPAPKPAEEDDEWAAVPAFLRRNRKN